VQSPRPVPPAHLGDLLLPPQRQLEDADLEALVVDLRGVGGTERSTLRR
jgi:hypothetical protein